MNIAGKSSSSDPGSTSVANTPLKLAIVLLAAGQGSRLGSFPKALLKKNGKTFLESFCVEMSLLNPVELLIITGFHEDLIVNELLKLRKRVNIPIRLQHHPDAKQGQASTVRLALESLQSDFDVLAMCLCDQPNIDGAAIQFLLEPFCNREQSEQIILPMVDGQRGNPVLFSKAVIQAILSMPNMVCRTYMDLHPELVKIVQTEHLAYIQDVDTMDDILKLGITR